MQIKVKKIFHNSKIPTKGHPSDAGWDLYATEDVAIPAGSTALISTGVAFAIPDGYVGLIWDRSSMGVNGIHRFAGVIDSGYRGHVKVCLYNSTGKVYHVKRKDRIAQIVFQEAPCFEMVEVSDLSETMRGDGGFGSTGK